MKIFDFTVSNAAARLAQSVEHQTFNLRVKGSSPLSGGSLFAFFFCPAENLSIFPFCRKLRLGTVIHFYFGVDLISVISVQAFFT